MIEHKETSGNDISGNYGPFVTPEKYAELTGFSIESVTKQAQRGKLPLLQRSESNPSRRILINMSAIQALANEQAQQSQEWKANF